MCDIPCVTGQNGIAYLSSMHQPFCLLLDSPAVEVPLAEWDSKAGLQLDEAWTMREMTFSCLFGLEVPQAHVCLPDRTDRISPLTNACSSLSFLISA